MFQPERATKNRRKFGRPHGTWRSAVPLQNRWLRRGGRAHSIPAAFSENQTKLKTQPPTEERKSRAYTKLGRQAKSGRPTFLAQDHLKSKERKGSLHQAKHWWTRTCAAFLGQGFQVWQEESVTFRAAQKGPTGKSCMLGSAGTYTVLPCRASCH